MHQRGASAVSLGRQSMRGDQRSEPPIPLATGSLQRPEHTAPLEGRESRQVLQVCCDPSRLHRDRPPHLQLRGSAERPERSTRAPIPAGGGWRGGGGDPPLTTIISVLGIIGRAVGRVLTSSLGWATSLLYGRVPADHQVFVEAMFGAAVLWGAVVI